MNHKILKKPRYAADGQTLAFYIYECKTHGTLSFFIEGLSCVRNDSNPKIEFIEKAFED